MNQCSGPAPLKVNFARVKTFDVHASMTIDNSQAVHTIHTLVLISDKVLMHCNSIYLLYVKGVNYTSRDFLILCCTCINTSTSSIVKYNSSPFHDVIPLVQHVPQCTTDSTSYQ